MRRAAGWIALVALLELVVRAVVYGMNHDPLGAGDAFGGPGFAAVVLVAVGLGVVLSSGLVWIASLGVRERWALAEDRPAGPAPRIARRPLLLRALALTLVGWVVFAGVETLVHMRAGLGFHGLECLVGPGHRNALPVVCGLALIATALLAAGRLWLAWLRRTVGRFVAPRAVPRARRVARIFTFSAVPGRAPLIAGASPRGPPCGVA
jgi:hypothetical protein